jgi:hypothetical protein
MKLVLKRKPMKNGPVIAARAALRTNVMIADADMTITS